MTLRSDDARNSAGFEINQGYIEDLAQLYHGNVTMMLTAAINAYISILSEIYAGNALAVADRMELTAAGVANMLRDGHVQLARGVRH